MTPHDKKKMSFVRLVTYCLLGAGLGVGVQAANDARVAAARMTSPSYLEQSRVAYDQFQCLSRRLHAQVAPGSAVVVVSNNDYWDHRLKEMATPAFRVVTDRRSATVAVDVKAVRAVPLSASDPLARYYENGCGGIGLEIQRP